MDYRTMSTEKLVEIYTDLGAMEEEMDCSESEWSELCKELENRNF